MLETRDLVKIYKPKKGVPVRALNGVSLKFPDKGMVFLLGKSGCGKSTLLNVLGGLDRYNSGEIFIKGKSAKTFRQRHFDSYRNTYVGFIFQEYNVLEEFSVGANIGLALQLQGQKPTSERINAILKEVDLEGFGSRKPNELSGGQKQRIAIARALVKNPEIIMADEPTGALDSVTGRQVLVTLKKLSKEKLVIVVSHDREFAEQYADRIIELSDGSVIRDVERQFRETDEEATLPIFEEDTVSIPEGYVLTEEDQRAICDYIQKMVSSGKAPNFELHSAEGREDFYPTQQEKIQSSKDGYHLIKSKLPMKFAFKLGASGLKYKKFRLVMTILLSCIAFILFGLADTMASYNYVNTSVKSLTDPESQVSYAAFEKQQKFYWGDDEEDFYWDYAGLTEEDYDLIQEKTGITMYPVLAQSGAWQMGLNMDANFYQNLQNPDEFYNYGYSQYYMYNFAGYVETSEELLEDMGAQLEAGSLPKKGTNEIAISSYVLETFREYGYADESGDVKIKTAEDMLGKKLTLDGIEYTVCGVVDTGIDLSRYDSLKEELDDNAEFTEYLLRMVMEQELRYASNYSLAGLAMVSEGQLGRICSMLTENRDFNQYFWLYDNNYNEFQFGGRYGTLASVQPKDIVWLDGQERTTLADNELVIHEDIYLNALHNSGRYDIETDFREQFKSENPDYSAIMGIELNLEIRGKMVNEMETKTMQIVGIIPMEAETKLTHLISDSIMSMVDTDSDVPICQTIAPMPEKESDIRRLVAFTDEVFSEDGKENQFNLMNPVSFELKNLDEVFMVLRTVFMWIGVVFVVFASLLFSNFIATSISYKKREIGILRAIGSRSNDVFRIFFAESFIIAMINYVISMAGIVGICAVINYFIRNSAGLLLTILNVGIRQVLLLFAICLVVAAVASFLPVRRIAAKRPIDAIKEI